MKGKMKPTVKLVFIVVLWILALLAALFPARYINTAFGYTAFFFLLLLLVFSLLILFAVRRRIEIETNVTDAHSVQCLRGDPVELGLKVKNGSAFFCPRATGGFYISDLFGGVDTSTDTVFTIAARSDSGFDFGMDMKHIGVYQVGLKDLRVYDMFGFFSLPVPVSGDFEVYVKPRIRTMEDLVVEEEIFLDSNRDNRNTVPNGIDYVGVREYTPGDSMKQIHWKLSAHSLGYMTKLSESTRQSDFAVALDFAAYPAEREELMDLYDALVETAFSLLEELSRREVTYSLIYSDKQQEIRRSVPKGRANDMEYIRRFDVITPEPEPGYPDGARLISQEARMPNRCTNLVLCTSRITPELIQELISVKRQKRSPELYFVFPDRLTRRDRENLMAPLCALDDAGVPWHAVSTAGNRQTGSADADAGKGQMQEPGAGEDKS
ncbi:MAG: DUF58 domain-containing protein [Lachnospiraceae bacterium]|nr:DUF58 domain-containing protein [Lachnospiraceae bacterium]